MVIPCRLCTEFEQKDEDLKRQLQIYMDSLSKEQKVEDQLYRQRLEKCDTCEGLRQGLCKFCGCFVTVRAIKKQMSCPNPKGKMW